MDSENSKKTSDQFDELDNSFEKEAFSDSESNDSSKIPFLKSTVGKILIGAACVLIACVVIVVLQLSRAKGMVSKNDFDHASKIYSSLSFLPGISDKQDVVEALQGFTEGNDDGLAVLLDNGISVNVLYNLNGGKFSNDNYTTTHVFTPGDTNLNLHSAYKDYYDFVTWKASRIAYNPKFDQYACEIELEAEFNPIEYTISYVNLLGGESFGPETYTYESDTFTISTASRIGYTFDSWEGTDLEKGTKLIVIPQGSFGNRVYSANWIPNEYSVSFEPGNEYPQMKDQVISFGSEYKLPTLNRKGYTQTSWTSTSHGALMTGVWNIPENVTVTPVWEIINYKLTYNLNGGTLAEKNPTDYTVETSDISLKNPTRYGYKFIGWSANGRATSTSTIIKKGTVGNISFNANWQGNPHTVTMDVNGGTVSSKTYGVIFGNEYVIPTPSRVGYTFQGWFAGNTQYSTGVWNVDKDVTVVASWSANKYVLSFNSNGGTSASSQTVTYDSSYSLPTPSRKGYSFQGWYKDGKKFEKGIWKTAGNVELTAQWKGNPHVITFSVDYDVSLSQSKQNVVFGDKYSLPTPYKKGYTFLGWVYNSTVYSSGTWDIDADVTMKASWEKSKYNIIFNANGGTCSLDSKTVTYGDYINVSTFPVPTRTGYTFNGWNYGSNNYTSQTYEIESDIELTAAWTPKTTVIYYDANGGTVSSARDSAVYDSSYSLLTPTRTGYTFSGWYYQSSGISTGGTWKMDIASITLTATWTVKEYKITFDYGNGTSNTVKTVQYGGMVSLPSTPTRTGYTFSGWTLNGSSYSGGYWNTDSDATVKATWTANQYYISFDRNGGSGTATTMYVSYDDNISESALPVLTKTGYEFSGWTLNGQPYHGGKYQYLTSIILVANWTEITQPNP